MNAFIRQMASLSVVWSLCELLLPEGRQQKLARLTVSVLVMAALVTAVNGLLGGAADIALPAWVSTAETAGAQSYARIALTAMANQAEGLCVRLANRAGYQARAAVYLRLDGSLEHVELWLDGLLDEASPPLLNTEETAARVAERLETPRENVWLQTDGADAS